MAQMIITTTLKFGGRLIEFTVYACKLGLEINVITPAFSCSHLLKMWFGLCKDATFLCAGVSFVVSLIRVKTT